MENISQVPLLDTGCNCDVYASDWWYQALHILVNSDIWRDGKWKVSETLQVDSKDSRDCLCRKYVGPTSDTKTSVTSTQVPEILDRTWRSQTCHSLVPAQVLGRRLMALLDAMSGPNPRHVGYTPDIHRYQRYPQQISRGSPPPALSRRRPVPRTVHVALEKLMKSPGGEPGPKMVWRFQL